MRTRRFAKRLTACLLAGCLLCLAPHAAARGWAPLLPWDDPQPAYGAGTARSETQQAYGSAGLLGWPSVLVSVYLDEQNGEGWDGDSIARARRQLAMAVGWLQEQCAAYRAYPAIHYDDGTPDSGLFVHETYRGRILGGEDGEESEQFYDAVDTLCAGLDTDELHERYGTASVGFLIFLPVAGTSFSMVHCCEDGSSFYHEYSCLYRYDAWSAPGTWEGPAAYAHEILHLFGAPDLYDGSADPYVTPALLDYVGENWPDAIMADTYSEDGIRYDAIDKSLCPLTACRLGLCATWPGGAEYPDSMLAPAGVFTTGNTAPDFKDGATAA